VNEPITDERLAEIEAGCAKGYPLSFDVTLALVAEVRRLRAVARENLAEEDRLRKILGARSDEDEIDAARRAKHVIATAEEFADVFATDPLHRDHEKPDECAVCCSFHCFREAATR
jgi:hypothetical protein